MDNTEVVSQESVPERLPQGSPAFLCPSCECPLEYAESRATKRANGPGDVIDYYRCPAGCGTFEHERRAHRFRIVGAGYAPPRRRAA
jgi:hypothetical protein